MRSPLRAFLTWSTVVSLALASIPAAAGGGAVLEGLVVGEDGRAADGYTIHLIGEGGSAVAASPTGDGGLYSFRDLDAGRYSMGVENPIGEVAPVAGPPLELAAGQLARRDLKMLSASNQQTGQAIQGNASLGTWWAGLTPAAKAWSVVAVVVVIGITLAALDDDEQPASDN